MAFTGSWVACACLLVVMSKTQVKEVLGDCNDAHSTILESVLASPHANEVIQSAVFRTFWSVSPTTTRYLRTIPVKGILSKDQLSVNFPSATSVLGPACYMQMQIYGRDLSYPMSPAVAATYAHIATNIYQGYSHLVITRAWSARPATPTNHYLQKGLQELMASLPGPPSPSCKASFREDDFHTQEICLEVWWRRNSFAAIIEYLNRRLRQKLKEWMHFAMADVGFPETYLLRNEQVHQAAALPFLKPSHFTPSLSFRFTLMMQGVCLFPFTTAKQIALESVLIPLMDAAGTVFTLKLERVTYAPPIVTHAANGSAHSYFFVNVTILCGKYEGTKFKMLSQLFGAGGPFVGKGGGPSPLQQALESVGLPVSALKATPPQLLHGHPPVTPRDQIQSMRDQQRRWWWWRGLLASGLTGAALLGGSIFLTGAFKGRCQRTAERRQEAPAGAAPTSVDPCEPATMGSQGLSSNDARQMLRALSLKTTESEARDITAKDSILDTGHLSISDAEEHARVIPTNEKAGCLIPSKGRGRKTPLDSYSDLRGLSRGSSSVCTIDVEQDVVQQSVENLGGPAADTGQFDALWDADIIPPQTLEICRRPDGTPWNLGRGSFGQVVKGLRDGVHEVALKISRPGLSRELIMREMSLLKSCQNSNIVQFLGVCQRRDSVWLVMEYMPGGDLRSFLKLQEKWSWGPRAAGLALDISRGLAYLHSQRVIHMDLKSGNVLLTSGGQAKVADVGMAQILEESRTHGSNLGMGTFTYTAPEIILYGKGGWSADVYSFGVILWCETPMISYSEGRGVHILTGRFPLPAPLPFFNWTRLIGILQYLYIHIYRHICIFK
eukprot:jgi/Botrbrau1/23610/Bobra.55_2s0006.3